MQTRRWVNPTQPQTLQIGVFLLYFSAAVLFLFNWKLKNSFVLLALYGPHGVAGSYNTGVVALVWLALVAAGVAGGYGIANEKKWGYIAGLVAAIVPLAARLY